MSFAEYNPENYVEGERIVPIEDMYGRKVVLG